MGGIKISRYFFAAFAVLLSLGFSSQSFAEALAENVTNTRCERNELKIVAKERGNDKFLYRLNEVLKIEVMGDCFDYINAVLEQNNTIRPPLELYLGGVGMSSLTVTPVGQIGYEKMILEVQLSRTSDNEESRKNWDEFLGRQPFGFIMQPAIGLSIDGKIPLDISNTGIPFRFYIAEKEWVIVTAGFGALLFFAAFYLLIKNPTALRDEKSELYSLGKSQMAFWGLLVIISFTCIWFLTLSIEQIPEQILMLMGLSGATALGSIVISENKKSVGKAEKKKDLAAFQDTHERLAQLKSCASGEMLRDTEIRMRHVNEEIRQLVTTESPLRSKGFFRDICDGGNGLSFHRLQAVLWTVVLGVIFVMSIRTSISMPEFPKNLLLLLGVSNLTYIGFKFPNEKKV